MIKLPNLKSWKGIHTKKTLKLSKIHGTKDNFDITHNTKLKLSFFIEKKREFIDSYIHSNIF